MIETDRTPPGMTRREVGPLGANALDLLLRWLREQDYRFVTPSPATHSRAIKAKIGPARTLREIFGWSLSFSHGLLPPQLHHDLLTEGILENLGSGLFRSTVRVSRVHEVLFAHSAYPTEAEDAIFLGPDSYRFADFIRREVAGAPAHASILDYGAGSGVGGILAARWLPGSRLTLADMNPRALVAAASNARAAGVDAKVVRVDSFATLPPGLDLIVMNPPYMIDAKRRMYRHGGEMRGAAVALDWACKGAARLSLAGRLLLYSGVAIVDGRDLLREALDQALGAQFRVSYNEVDPDIFGEELDTPAYEGVERIAAITARIEKRDIL